MKNPTEMEKNKITISEPTDGKIKENNSEKVHLQGKTKRVLSPAHHVWEKINGLKSKVPVPDQFLQPFCSTEEIERTRVYHVWPGNNVFFFRGRLICGPDPKGLLFTVISIGLSSWTFAVHVASDLGNQYSTVIISSILTVIVFINLGMVSTMDPGIIPRNQDDSSSVETGDEKRSNRVVIINGMEVKLKYCKVCNIYRPPRSSHCLVCDNCVEKFDHHCPWIGQCIGLRNYRYFLTFLATDLALFLYILVMSFKRIKQKLHGGDGVGMMVLVRDSPQILVLATFSIAAVCFLGVLCSYHAYIITTNQTAFENFHQDQSLNSRNPYNKGILKNIKEGLLSSQSPSRVNFQAHVQSHGYVESM